jgi:hypothetical protein
MCTVASAPAAFRVRVWQITSWGRGPRGRQPLPEGPSVGYPPRNLARRPWRTRERRPAPQLRLGNDASLFSGRAYFAPSSVRRIRPPYCFP